MAFFFMFFTFLFLKNFIFFEFLPFLKGKTQGNVNLIPLLKCLLISE